MAGLVEHHPAGVRVGLTSSLKSASKAVPLNALSNHLGVCQVFLRLRVA